jgi:hypothetical protein
MSCSDLDFTHKPAAVMAIDAVTNICLCKLFSRAGRAELDGFEERIAGQCQLKQGLFETDFIYKGFSL